MQFFRNRNPSPTTHARASSSTSKVDDAHLQCAVCGQSHSVPDLKPGQRAQCERCGTTLAERGWLGPHGALVFALTGLILAVPSLLLPFVILRKFGSERISLLTRSGEGLWDHGFHTLGAWVLFCGTVAPCCLLLLVVAICLTDRAEKFRAQNDLLRRWAHHFEYWSVPDVQVLGVMVAFFKLGDVVAVSVGPGLWCFGAMSLFTLLAWRRLNLRLPRDNRGAHPSPDVVAVEPNPPPRSLAIQVAVLAASAVVLLLPAYGLPVMHLGIPGKNTSDTTILSGIVQLWQQDLYGLAAIVFTASFLVPLLKLAGLAWLLFTVWRNDFAHARRLTRVYSTLDLIGRWSMLDVFLVAFLTGAVRFGKLASVQPRAGIVAFAGVVVLTMLATHRFDPRLLWTRPRAGASRREDGASGVLDTAAVPSAS